MLKKLTPTQLKIGIGLAFALFLVNGQNDSTAARNKRPVPNNNATPVTALAASPPPASSDITGCATAQHQVQLPADAVLNLRSYANGPVVATLPPGATVTAQRSDGAWLEVTTGSGQSGWAFSQYLSCR